MNKYFKTTLFLAALAGLFLAGFTVSPSSANAFVGGLAFSTTTLNMSSGQNTTVSIFGNSTFDNYYVSQNSNNFVASSTVSVNILTVYALTTGSTNITVCDGNNGQCGIVTVNVNGGGFNPGNGTITFSNANPVLTSGQSVSFTIFSNNSFANSYFVSQNSNSSVVTANISGNNINLFAQNSGTSTITVCQNNGNSQCGTMFVTVSGNGTINGTITFSNSNPVLSAGQSSTVTIFSNSGFNNYFVSQNSNSSIVNANISGSTLNLFASSASGTSTITVCQNNGSSSCGTLFVTVNGNGGIFNNGIVTFGTTNPFLTSGQTMTVPIFSSNNNFSNSYYISQNSNNGIVSASISGSNLLLYGLTSGSSTITVCQNNGNSSCGTLNLTVNGSNPIVFNNNGSSGLTFSTPNPSLSTGQSMAISIFTNNNNFINNGFYVSQEVNSNVVSANVTGITLNLFALSTGTSTITVCQNNTNLCGTLFVTVNNSTLGNNGGGTLGGTLGNNGQVLGASLYANGTLIQEGSTIYIVYKSTKTGFASYPAFVGFGFKLSNVANVGNSGLVNSGSVITTSNTSHPWGSWISYLGTVYFVDSQGLIPVPSQAVLNSNGGNNQMVVPANSHDLGLSLESVMTLNDSRMQ